jgi:hypothetical protein
MLYVTSGVSTARSRNHPVTTCYDLVFLVVTTRSVSNRLSFGMKD